MNDWLDYLEHSRSHKYIRREGTKGNYRYVYADAGAGASLKNLSKNVSKGASNVVRDIQKGAIKGAKAISDWWSDTTSGKKKQDTHYKSEMQKAEEAKKKASDNIDARRKAKKQADKEAAKKEKEEKKALKEQAKKVKAKLKEGKKYRETFDDSASYNNKGTYKNNSIGTQQKMDYAKRGSATKGTTHDILGSDGTWRETKGTNAAAPYKYEKPLSKKKEAQRTKNTMMRAIYENAASPMNNVSPNEFVKNASFGDRHAGYRSENHGNWYKPDHSNSRKKKTKTTSRSK